MSDKIIRGTDTQNNDVDKRMESEQPEEKTKSSFSKLKRAFSMPRNTLQNFSRSLKSKDSTNNVQQDTNDLNDAKTLKNGKKIFRRSSFTKFLTRIAQQMTSVNINVSQIQFIHSVKYNF